MKPRHTHAHAKTGSITAQPSKSSRKFQAAIETVFRLTHRREMTPEERRSFGLSYGHADYHPQKSRVAPKVRGFGAEKQDASRNSTTGS